LHKTVEEIEKISVTEFHGWIAYLKIERENAKRENAKNVRK
jgi:uncharacterized small protein (DUF1192 family)